MTSPDIPVGHIDDGELVRYLDNELELDALAVVRNHLGACTECQAKFEALRAQAERFQQAMADLDLPPAATPTVNAPEASIPSIPSSPAVGWGWRLAAMIAVVVGITLTVTPARAWLLDTLGSMRTLFEPANQTPPSLPPAVPVTGSSVLFAVTDTVLFVEFAVHPQAGTLSLQRGTSVTEVSAAMKGGSGNDELVVFGDGIRVVNTAQSTADYVITLPTGIVLVEVRIGGAVVARHRVDTATAPWTMELAQ